MRALKICSFLLFFFVSIQVTAQTGPGISTVAGCDYDIPATNAFLATPWSVAADASGNFYIAERAGERVTRVDAATGKITLFAGGVSTSLPVVDGVQAISSPIGDPSTVAIDHAGNIYVATYGRIRKIDINTKIITTVVGTGTFGYSGDGGPATSAQVNYAIGQIAFDGADNLYFADQENHRIRKVNKTTGIISTVVGNGVNVTSPDGGLAINTSVSRPAALAVTESGDIYVGTNYFIKKVSASTGIVSTIAGNGTNGISGDGGLAINAQLMGVSSLALDGAGGALLLR